MGVKPTKGMYHYWQSNVIMPMYNKTSMNRKCWNKGLTKKTDKRVAISHNTECMCFLCQNSRGEDFQKGRRNWQKNHYKEMVDFGKRSQQAQKQRPNYKSLQLEKAKKGGKRCHILYPNLMLKSHKKMRENSPYKWQHVGFMSEDEMKCAKFLLSKPIEGVNCHIEIENRIIDFFPQDDDLMYQGSFVEYHKLQPYWKTYQEIQTLEEYRKERRKIIEGSNFKGTPLIVIQKLSELK